MAFQLRMHQNYNVGSEFLNLKKKISFEIAKFIYKLEELYLHYLL